MTSQFPDTPNFQGYNEPVRVEAEIYDLVVIGDLPRDINGTWCRMTPDPQFPPFLGDDFFIAGDGMMSKFVFEEGHVDFKCRYVQTERMLAERKARRRLFGAYRNPYTDLAEVSSTDRTTANTTPIWHAGRLLACKEDGRPYELDLETLDTIGVFDWNGRLRSKTISAHCKVDPKTKELFIWGYEVTGEVTPHMMIGLVDAEGELVREEWFEAPFVGMVHDFAFTDDYIIFPIFPTIADPERLRAGGDHWMSDIARDAAIAIMPRVGSANDIRWFNLPGGQSFHVINAWNEGDLIFVDLCLAEINPFPFIRDVAGFGYDPMRASTLPWRWKIDLSSENTISELLLGQVIGDLPRIDDRRAGQRYHQAYMAMVDPAREFRVSGPVGPGFNMVGRFEPETGLVDAWYGTDDDAFQEPQFVPNGPGETDGYVLSVIERHDRNGSDVGIFKAGNMADGPIALVRMPLKLRGAVHGCWIPNIEK